MELSPAEVLMMEDQTLLNTMEYVCLENPSLEKELHNLKYGYKAHFDLRAYVRGSTQEIGEKLKAQKVFYHDTSNGKRMVISLHAFRDELDKRRARARQVIIQATQPKMAVDVEEEK